MEMTIKKDNRTNNIDAIITNIIVAYRKTYGFSPTVRDIGKFINFSSSCSVHIHIKSLYEKGTLESESYKTTQRAYRVKGDTLVITNRNIIKAIEKEKMGNTPESIILRCICDYITEHLYAPSIRELNKLSGFSNSRINQIINQLESQKYIIRRTPENTTDIHHSRTISLNGYKIANTTNVNYANYEIQEIKNINKKNEIDSEHPFEPNTQLMKTIYYKTKPIYISNKEKSIYTYPEYFSQKNIYVYYAINPITSDSAKICVPKD